MGAAAEINRSYGQGFVHGHYEITGAENAAFFSQSLQNGFAEGDAHVFDGVMLIDIEIATGNDMQIEGAMASDKIEHVIEKADASGNARFGVTVEIQFELDVRLIRFAVNRCGAGHDYLFP
jgi:hypothetical protein